MKKIIILFVVIGAMCCVVPNVFAQEAIFRTPVTVSYDAPLDSAAESFTGILPRVDFDMAFQSFGTASPNLLIGAEIGISLSVATLGGLAWAAFWDTDYTTTTALHAPVRLVFNFALADSAILDMDVYSGVQLNYTNHRSHEAFDMTVDVGGRLYINKLIVGVSYSLPFSVDFTSTVLSEKLWSNAVTFSLGFRDNSQ